MDLQFSAMHCFYKKHRQQEKTNKQRVHFKKLKTTASLRTRTHKEALLDSKTSFLKQHVQIYQVSLKIFQFSLTLHLVKIITRSFPNFKAIIIRTFVCCKLFHWITFMIVTSWMLVANACYLHRGCHSPRTYGNLLSFLLWIKDILHILLPLFMPYYLAAHLHISVYLLYLVVFVFYQIRL